MSRLAGRVTFPGASDSQEQDQPTSSSTSNRPQNPRGPPKNRYADEERSKPRGKGNVRYQGTYSDKFETSERDSEGRTSQNMENRLQKQSDRDSEFRRPQKYENRRQETSERDSDFRRPQKTSDRDSESRRQQTHHRKPTQRVEDVMPSEELLEIEDFIEQISDLNIRNDRSAAQIKRNILASQDLIDTMSSDDWEKVCRSMLTTALDQGEPEFIADLIVALFNNRMFSAVMSDELMAQSSDHIIENDEKPIPALLSAILCAHWPRQYAKAFDNINPILYTVVCIVKGWIEVVNEDTGVFYKEEKKRPEYKSMNRDESKDVAAPEPEEPKEIIPETPEMVNCCAVALSDLCDTAQRQLWVNWMAVTDEIYQCIKPSITHNQNLTGDVKARLLDTFIQMNQWTKNRQAGIKHAGVQTVPTA
ncbi:hypothetical protein GCK72_008590 [Caenorhabditis remanei]|uniref:DUF7627 domain-containing protein n=1 Tax=Caenorhabditis remanei TaxID=31234 RepID=A0A6A5H030_CAERE|nr:hypothetical protein GCK72_008590 [Caenorhabditis remanei]KAF1760341.1 hypothetical protein GCK72_008590 [Caenorhabditis remanei]